MPSGRQTTDERTTNLGTLLTNRRSILRMTQEQVANEAKMPKSTYTELERGSRTPTFLHVCKLARVLQIDPGNLVRMARLDPRDVEDIEAVMDFKTAVRKLVPNAWTGGTVIISNCHMHKNWIDPAYWDGVYAELGVAS
jgi:transcriptional regulator with XRE-family HTH domain